MVRKENLVEIAMKEILGDEEEEQELARVLEASSDAEQKIAAPVANAETEDELQETVFESGDFQPEEELELLAGEEDQDDDSDGDKSGMVKEENKKQRGSPSPTKSVRLFSDSEFEETEAQLLSLTAKLNALSEKRKQLLSKNAAVEKQKRRKERRDSTEKEMKEEDKKEVSKLPPLHPSSPPGFECDKCGRKYKYQDFLKVHQRRPCT